MEQIKRGVIKKHLEGWNGDLKNESIKNFAQSGKTSGSFFIALKEMLDDYVEQLRLHGVVGRSEQLPDANKRQCNCSNTKDRLNCGFECYNK